MPALVETMFSVGQVPWHGLGKNFKEGAKLSITEGITAAGLDWEVGLVPAVSLNTVADVVRQVQAGQLPKDVPTTSYNLITRNTDGMIYGVVKDRWPPLQNKEAFQWFQPFLDAGLCSLHTGGSLAQGEIIWVLAEINSPNSEIVPGDNVSKFILLSNSHDGGTSVRVGFTPIRVVCANTLSMAHHSKASKLIRIRHSDKMKTNLDKLRDIMNLANQEFEATADQFRFLASKDFKREDVVNYVKLLLDCDGIPESELPTQSLNNIRDILKRVSHGIGNDAKGVSGTWWAAYNGVTEWLNYKRGHNTNTRMNSLWFGPNAKLNNTALEKALEYATAS